MTNKPKTPNEIIKSWTPEDWDRIGEAMVQEMAQQEQDLITFKNSARF